MEWAIRDYFNTNILSKLDYGDVCIVTKVVQYLGI